jgi:gas vesicle protein
VSNTGRSVTMFLIGLGIGGAAALLFAPQSGEETRDWIADTADKKAKFLRRKGQQSIDNLQDAVAMGGEKVSQLLKSSKDALDAVSAKLD